MQWVTQQMLLTTLQKACYSLLLFSLLPLRCLLTPLEPQQAKHHTTSSLLRYRGRKFSFFFLVIFHYIFFLISHVSPMSVDKLKNEDRGCSLPSRQVAQQGLPPLWMASSLQWGKGLKKVFQYNEGSEQGQSVWKNTLRFKAKQKVLFNRQTCRTVKTGYGKVSLNIEKTLLRAFPKHKSLTPFKQKLNTKSFQIWYIRMK